MWHVRTGKADTGRPGGHVIISPHSVCSTLGLLPLEEGPIWSSEHFIFIQTCKPSKKEVCQNLYFLFLKNCLMTCSKVDVTLSQSLTMSDLVLTSGKLSEEHLTPRNWHFKGFNYLLFNRYVSKNLEVLSCNPNSLSCLVPLHTSLAWCWSGSQQFWIHHQ